MKISILLSFVFLLLFSPFSLQSQTKIAANDLQKDFQILEQALKELHPGLYRYNDKSTIEGYFNDLQKELQTDKTLQESYLIFSQFLAKIQCGHTFCNFWNQPKEVNEAIFMKADKVPFTFRLIDRRMIVVKDATKTEQLPMGTEILKINNIEVATIVDSLLTVVKTDGDNVGSQLENMQLSGTGEFEDFDVFFSLFFPPQNGKFEVKAMDLQANKAFELSLNAVSRGQRFEVLEKRYGKQASSYDDMWSFEIWNKQTAYLQLGTFVTWKMEMNWKQFLKDAFVEIHAKNIPNLVIDIRGNAGGMDDVTRMVADFLLTKDITLSASRSLLTYEKVPENLNGYLSTWDDKFRDRTGKLKSVEGGFYTFKKATGEPETIKANKNAYGGKTYLIVNAANSSATFFMAKYFKQHGLATLVGQETGGNRKGTTGGNMFFLQLPHSKIEIDIPLIGDYPLGEQPNEGIQPDVLVRPNVEDVVNGVDTELEVVKKLIVTNGSETELKSKTTTQYKLNGDELDVLEGKWTGKLTYLNFGDDKTVVDVPGTFEVEKVNGKFNTLITYDELDKEGKPMIAENVFGIKKGGKVLQLNGEWNIVKIEKTEGELLIVGERKGKDNLKKADLRLTVRLQNGQKASWKKEARYVGMKDYFMRNIFSFERVE
ncbi:MAG: S41 family peptidase [Chitinophagales bacterium]